MGVNILASYAPNLIADSGMTLTTFKPFPVGVRRIRHKLSRLTHRHIDCAYRPHATALSWPQQAVSRHVLRS
jgi:hypothetical protein